ncbi:hypothetical protein SAMN05428962_2386 [Paenibacillus sp. BC26]|nr:hypothetical protein SAMN05428962_2386 [Paenibacillus sp. BC26]
MKTSVLFMCLLSGVVMAAGVWSYIVVQTI